MIDLFINVVNSVLSIKFLGFSLLNFILVVVVVKFIFDIIMWLK